MTPYQSLKILGLLAEEIKAEHGVGEDGKPLPSGGKKEFGKEITAEEAEDFFRD